MGTLGIILRARREDRIPAAADILRRLKVVGLYLPEELLPGILAELGEVWP
jgi:predicted nucleic acid-binding protein